jgi:hypothetical protein
VTGIQRRLAEAARMGFRRAVIPAGSGLQAGAPQAAAGAAGRNRGRLASVDGPRPAARADSIPLPDGAAAMEVTEVTDMRSAISAALGLG